MSDVYTGIDSGLSSMLDRAAAGSSRKSYLAKVVKDHLVGEVKAGKLEVKSAEEAKAMGFTEAEQAELKKKAERAHIARLEKELAAAKKAIGA